MNFTITSDQLLWLFSFCGAAWGVVKVIKELKKPSDDLKTSVEEHERKLTNDHKRLTNLEESQKLIMKSNIAIIDHMISGNSVDNLKNVKGQMIDYLANK